MLNAKSVFCNDKKFSFRQSHNGAVLYDDHDLRALDAHSVRQQLGVVLQNSAILPGSIYENVTSAKALTRDEVWEILRLARLEDDVKAMPMGLDTNIAEQGNTLSVGQRQRLLIARALAIKPRILILDEATSSLDNTTQKEVMSNIIKLPCTKIVIAHRFSTVVDADKIYVLGSRGSVVQQGIYSELVKQPGLFQDLAKRQQL